jgi:hypothetical protein
MLLFLRHGSGIVIVDKLLDMGQFLMEILEFFARPDELRILLAILVLVKDQLFQFLENN